MKLIGLMLLVLSMLVGCKSLPGIPNINMDNQLVKLQTEEMNAMKTEIASMKNTIDANAGVITGLNNTLSQVNKTITSGRDNNINDSKLMERIFEMQASVEEATLKADRHKTYMWYAVCIALISLLGTSIALMGTLIKLMMKFFTKYMFYKEQTYMRIKPDERNGLKELQKK